jgi:outer membrane protein W
MVSSLVLVAALVAPQTAESRPTPRPRVDPRPHTFAIGGSAGTSAGGGVAIRYWFNQHIGLDAGVSFDRGYTGTTVARASTLQVMPSVIYLFREQNADAGIDMRPYLGAGVNYSKAFLPNAFVRAADTRTSGTGSQVLGGIEMSFKEIDYMTISGELSYFWMPLRFSGSPVFDGLNYEFAFHFYFK